VARLLDEGVHVADRDSDESFAVFAKETEPRLRHALVAVFGQDRGREATADALAYAFENWDRIESMDNPAGYLYRVGRSRGYRVRYRPRFLAVPVADVSNVEPGLPDALRRLSAKQRVAVVMVHAYGWSREETASLMGVSLSTVDTHVQRGLAKLRTGLGVSSHV
jgi:DNA-directed RNA polymerase specialized sigma24 family protein